jgi:hypothetical protein
MKKRTTMRSRSTANPRRTTLASIEDFPQLPAQARIGSADGAATGRRPESIVDTAANRSRLDALLYSTANPRRTVLIELPGRRPEPLEVAAGAHRA